MSLRKHFLEAATLIAAAVLCAVVSNAVASRERKLVTVGSYPNALKVPAPAADPDVVAPATPPASASAAPEHPPSATMSPSPANTSTANTSTAVSSANTSSAAHEVTVTQQPASGITATRGPADGVVGATTLGGGRTVAAQPRNAAGSQAAATQAPPLSPKSDLSRYAPHADKQYIEIAYPDVAALHAGGALFLDARRTSVYEQGHIPGARPFSVWESDVGDKVRGLWEQRQDPKEQALPIVIYCSGGDCEDSHMLSEKLWGAQFSNLYVYKDGFPDWQAHRGAVHTGSNP